MKNGSAGLIKLLSIILAINTLSGCSYSAEESKSVQTSDKPSYSVNDVDTTRKPITEDVVINITPSSGNEVTVSITPGTDVSVDVVVSNSTDVVTTVDDTFFVEEGDLILDEEGPCVLLDPENVVFPEIENDNYENQVNLVRDLTSFSNEGYEYLFFDKNTTAEELYQKYAPHIDLLNFLVNFGISPEQIVWEFNNLYVLSQTPSCMPEEAWQHYFGAMDSVMSEYEYSLYEKYIYSVYFVHNRAAFKQMELKK